MKIFLNIIKKLSYSDNKRSNLVKKNIVLSFLLKIIGISTSFLLVPLTINYISSELYGIWLTLTSIVFWIGFFDFGIGNGLRNKLAESIALANYKVARIYVSSSYALFFFIFLFIGGFSFFCADYINWSHLLKIDDIYNNTVKNAAKILILTISLRMILSVISHVIYAFQLSALSSSLDVFGNLLSLIAIYILTVSMLPNFIYVTAIFSISPIFIFIIFSIWLYSSKLKEVRPSFSFIDFSYTRNIVKLGGAFFILQIGCLIIFQSTNILISRLCGPEYVTVYNVANKYLSVSLMIFNIILSPIWSAFTDAYTKKDKAWMLSIYNKLIKLFILTSILTFFMIIFSPIVYKVWLGDSVSIPFHVSVLVGVYIIISLWGAFHATIINGIGKIRFQCVISIIMQILFIPLAYVLGKNFSLEGIIFALIATVLHGIFWCRYQVLHLINGTAKGIFNR